MKIVIYNESLFVWLYFQTLNIINILVKNTSIKQLNNIDHIKFFIQKSINLQRKLYLYFNLNINI